VLAAFLLAGAVLAPSAAGAQAPMPQLIAHHGFGDRENSYSWSMAWFKGKLYVGTGRNVVCVESAVSQFYFQSEQFYTENPFLNVHCAPDPYDLDLRAEIWEYTPQTGRWRRVFRSPADIPNPRARGKFLARDIAFRGMTVMRDRRGRKALFVSGVTSNEYVPEIARRHPPRLLRTFDGRRFHDISRLLVVKRSGGFPSRRPMGYRGLKVWRDQLFVVASTSLTGDGAVFRVRNPFGRKGRFTQVTPTDMHVFELETFGGDLYVGTGSYEDGYGVYRTRRTSAPFEFEPVVTGGAGIGSKMVSVLAMHPFRDQLYVAAVSWANWEKEFPTTELIRVSRNGRFEVVTGWPRPGPDGQLLAPISGLPPGFGNIFNAHIWRMIDKDGALYAGTLDLSGFFQGSEQWAPEWSPLIEPVLSFEYGFDLWASCDGVDWVPVTRTAFDRDPKFDFGVRGLAAARRGFFIGSANHAFGTDVWRDRRRPCASRSGARRARASGTAGQAPRHLLTDVQQDGTVVSWERSGPGVRYRVERAEYVEAPLSLRSPAGLPSGVWPEPAATQPAPAGAPGSLDVQVPVRTRPTVLGTTTRPYFVDRTRRPGTRYEYQVFAEANGRERDVPSNVQVVPDPRPPATFDQLEDATSGLRASAASIRPRHGARRAPTVARLLRLARTSGDDRVRQLAYRLARRVTYEDVAGGPARRG
jgi:hypothetical protein